ncbi:MAG: hypothetical protein HY907_14805 [Deltaproteobacteria bacterium]|nr:hypothetical protein [Deltaproteobacteria bacterium]
MDAQEYAAQVEDLEKKLERLRALYEQYFMGIERLEPSIMRHDVEKRFRLLRKERCSNTAVRFRFQTLIQRHTTLMAHWQKICRAIEEGTYEPHIQRAQRLLAKQAALAGEPPPPPPAAGKRAARTTSLVIDVDVDVADLAVEEPEGSARAIPPVAPAAPKRPESTGPAAPVMQVRTLDALRALLMDTSELASRIELPDSSPTIPAAARPAATEAAGKAKAAVPAPPPRRPNAVPAPPHRRPPDTPASSPSEPALAVRVEGPGLPAPSLAVRPAAPVRAAPAAPPVAAVPARPVASTARAGPPAEDKAEAIRAAFAAAAGRASSAVKVPSAEAIRKSLEKETERLSRKHPGQKVEFRVDVKDGKPLIKSFVLPPGKS